MDAGAIKPAPQAYVELQQAYDFFNRELFGGELQACLITFQREHRAYGYFSDQRFFDPTSGRVTNRINRVVTYLCFRPDRSAETNA
jgi:hypothetical protein